MSMSSFNVDNNMNATRKIMSYELENNNLRMKIREI